MKKLALILLSVFVTSGVQAQDNLPHFLSKDEINIVPDYLRPLTATQSPLSDPPPTTVRTPAEWEEAQALVITWTSYPSILTEIVRHAKEEVLVYIVTQNPNNVTSYLENRGVTMENVEFIDSDFNSLWIRDYGPWSVYSSENNELWNVDWIYNRPRPDDDMIPAAVTAVTGIPLYETSTAPKDFVSTGGNFMTDGWGTGFSSDLVLEENEPNNPYNVTPKTEAEIDAIMNEFMGINRYIKMPTLPYDAIHHIDMHMKLLDEETILVGEYPEGVADGPQIEENIEYIQNNFNSVFGTPYNIVRIPMPPDNGLYPDNFNADYRTYANALIVNKTILVPIYEEQYDTVGLKIWEENMPGYNVVGIDCNEIIPAFGAIHCITKLIMTDDPLWISHQKLRDSYDESSYEVRAHIDHASGISGALVYYRTNESENFESVPMSIDNSLEEFKWAANIPYQANGTKVEYYIQAFAQSGKTITRPLPGADGAWEFEVFNDGTIASLSGLEVDFEMNVSPNPANEFTTLQLTAQKNVNATLEVTDIFGKSISTFYEGNISTGEQNFTIETGSYAGGIYLVKMNTASGSLVKKLIVN